MVVWHAIWKRKTTGDRESQREKMHALLTRQSVEPFHGVGYTRVMRNLAFNDRKLPWKADTIKHTRASIVTWWCTFCITQYKDVTQVCAADTRWCAIDNLDVIFSSFFQACLSFYLSTDRTAVRRGGAEWTTLPPRLVAAAHVKMTGDDGTFLSLTHTHVTNAFPAESRDDMKSGKEKRKVRAVIRNLHDGIHELRSSELYLDRRRRRRRVAGPKVTDKKTICITQ